MSREFSVTYSSLISMIEPSVVGYRRVRNHLLVTYYVSIASNDKTIGITDALDRVKVFTDKVEAWLERDRLKKWSQFLDPQPHEFFILPLSKIQADTEHEPIL